MSYKARDFNSITAYFDRATYDILKDKARELGLPVGRLVSYAVDNELDSAVPFSYPCPMPDTSYVEHSYAAEARILYQYLGKFNNGIGRDYLMLNRRDIGIPDREKLMLAYRELMEQGMILETKPPGLVKFKGYLDTYRYTRCKHGKDESAQAKRAKIIQMQKELQDQLKAIDEPEDKHYKVELGE